MGEGKIWASLTIFAMYLLLLEKSKTEKQLKMGDNLERRHSQQIC
jgi:hypothetical protein